MAERILTLTIADVRALADRLWARGNSKLVEENNVKGDLRTAARVIWNLAAKHGAPDTIMIPADE